MNSKQHNQELTINELNKVQILIESCLQQYMSHNEVVNTLKLQANVETTFTKIVWQKLEEQNPEFFKAYNLRLMVKDQILQFNNLLERQRELIRQTQSVDVAHVPRSNRSHVSQLHFDSDSYVQLHHGHMISNGLSNTIFHTNDSQNTHLAQNTNVGMIQGMNGLSVGLDDIHADDTLLPYLNDANFSSSELFLRNLDISDFANNYGDNLGDIFKDEFVYDDFGSE